MGDRLATIDMGQEVGGSAVPLSVRGAGSPSNTMWLGQGLPPYQVVSWSIQPFGHNTPTSKTDRTDNGPISQSEQLYKRSTKNQCHCVTKTY